ncbi:MAG: ATP synthase F1 subunit delta [Elusimicrobia bacterium]|nr:ATP synthase F1 subunit delta [Elusimicrobiota bacterium]
MKTKDDRDLAAGYAKSLFIEAGPDGACDRALADLKAVADSFKLKDPIWQTLQSPAIEQKEKTQALEAALARQLEPLVLALVKTLLARGRLRLLPGIAGRLAALMDESAGIMRAGVSAAFPLSQDQAAALQNKLESFSGKKVVLEIKEAPDLIGGLAVKAGDHYFENSFKLKVRRLREALAGG